MEYFWIALIVISIVPTAVASFYLNPFVFLLLGASRGREQMVRLSPYRWWFVVSLLTLTLSTTVYGTRYG